MREGFLAGVSVSTALDSQRGRLVCLAFQVMLRRRNATLTGPLSNGTKPQRPFDSRLRATRMLTEGVSEAVSETSKARQAMLRVHIGSCECRATSINVKKQRQHKRTHKNELAVA